MSPDIREELRGVIPGDLLTLVPRSFDVLGSRGKAVAIIEVPDELEAYGEEIGAALVRVNGNVKSVLSKESGRLGDFRVRELKLIHGDPDTEVVHKESGCLFKLDPRTTYFSPRESTERMRIASKVAEGEEVLVMFSGVGPFPICIARAHRSVSVTAVELNRAAHNYCVENVHLNRVEDRVTPILGDVREVCPRLGRAFDRVLMPLPKGAHQFLDVAIPTVREGGVLHFYHWAPEEELFKEAERLVIEEAKGLGREAEVIDGMKISQYSPRVWKVRVDARIY